MMDTNRTIAGFYLIDNCPRCDRINIISFSKATCDFCGSKIGRTEMKESLINYLDRESFVDCRVN